MPKESVYGEQHPFDPDDLNPMVPTVDVRWARDQGFVQLITKVEDPNGGRWIGEGDWDETVSQVTDGMFVDLNRESINQLIRNLRRARDQAFGRDE